jgi:maltooligosyltrehalose trehalohydrolase
MLFMGQEFASSRPFAFFADHQGELARLVHEGRREFLRQFRSYATPDAQARILDPALESTFRASVLDWSETQTHRAWLDLHRDLLKIRREDAVIAEQDARSFDGAVLGPHIFVLRWFDDVHGDRLLLVNLGVESVLNPSPEPLLAPPPAQRWELCWSSEHPRYGGRGAVHPCPQNASWRVEGECTVLLKAAP